jgi:hypothetical protein
MVTVNEMAKVLADDADWRACQAVAAELLRSACTAYGCAPYAWPADAKVRVAQAIATVGVLAALDELQAAVWATGATGRNNGALIRSK